jgi:TM2 domain-containing membrane protein YozV
MSVDLTTLSAHLPPEQRDAVQQAYRRRAENSTAAFLWCFFFGVFGAHRFYLRQWRSALLHLILPVLAVVALVAGLALHLSAGVIIAIILPLLVIGLVWELVDLFRIDHEVYTRNLKLAEDLIAGAALANHGVEQRASATMESLMQQATARADTAAQTERQQTAAVAQAAADALAGTQVATGTADGPEEVALTERQESAAQGYAAATYVASDVTQISATPDEPAAATPPAAQPFHDWSVTESVHSDDIAVEAGLASEAALAAAPGALAAAEADATAEARGVSVDETLTRAHSESDYTATDSALSWQTVGSAQAEQRDERLTMAAEPQPATDEPEETTWPEMPVVGMATVARAESVTGPLDVTDRSLATDEDVPIADIAPGTGPLKVVLPDDDDFGAVDVSVQPVAGSDAAAGDETLLLLVPDDAAGGVSDPLAAGAPGGMPPLVPVATEPPAWDDASAATGPTAPAAMSAAYESRAEPEERTAETLAELAPFAAASAPALAELAAPPADADVVTRPAEAAPEIAAPPPADAGAAGGLAPHHRLRRVRVVRQVKVNGQVVEETAAEEYIEPDEDPEPVRERLRERLRRQAAEEHQPGS